MSNCSVPFEARYNPHFEKQLAKLQKKDKIRAKRVLKKIKEICASPYSDVRFAAGRYAGKREARVGDHDRFLFVVCEQCRKEGHVAINGCPPCNEVKDETVIFFMMIEDHKY